MNREVHVRFCERLKGRFLGPTRPKRPPVRSALRLIMKHLFLFMFIVAPLANAESWYEGTWKISGAKFPGISAVGMDDISPYIGEVKAISKTSIPLKNSFCKEPLIEESEVSKEDFEFEYRASYEELGFGEGSVKVVSAKCKNKKDFVFSHMIQNNGVTYGLWEGVFIVLRNSKP
ncbi:hypothetical protein ACMDCT_07330 [Halomonadaceae bacterium KBTZ08]